MKDIMGASSSAHHNGVPLMGFSQTPRQPLLFEPNPLSNLQADLMRAFAGRTATIAQIFSEHHPTNECFLLRNYQEALRQLEASASIETDPPMLDRPKRSGIVTMGETVRITFPSRKMEL
jgi:hypothetical protein